MTEHIVLVKHAMPVLDDSVPPREWVLGAEGETQAKRLASKLERFDPPRLAASPEPKARRTGEIVAAQLGVGCTVIEGLEELDRPAAPLVGAEEHERRNAAIFAEPSRVVLGRESADDARTRFHAAISRALSQAPGTPVVVAHGTVISLFVAEHNAEVDAFELWKRLKAPSFVVLDRDTSELLEVVNDPLGLN